MCRAIEIDPEAVLERICASAGKAVTAHEAIAYQEAELNECRRKIENMEAEINARIEHIRLLEERQLKNEEENRHIVNKLSVQNEAYRSTIGELKRENIKYKNMLGNGVTIAPASAGNNEETIITVNRKDVDQVEIYFKGWQDK